MVEKVILEGRSAEDLIDLFRREGALTPQIKEYFTSYCDCDITEWLIAQLTAHNQEVVDRVNELLAAYDPYPVRRETKFPVHGHLVKTFCDGKDLKGYYAINSQGLQSYDKKIIVANSPLCGQYIIKDDFKRGAAVSSNDIADHTPQVGVNIYNVPEYLNDLSFHPRVVFVITPEGMKMFPGFKYAGSNIETIFETQGFSFNESVPWTTVPSFSMSATAFFPLIQGSTELADWPYELTIGFGYGAHNDPPYPNTYASGVVKTTFSFHRYNLAVVEGSAADPTYFYGSRFDPRSNDTYTETWFDYAAGFTTNTDNDAPKRHTPDSTEPNSFITDKIQAAINNGTATGHYRTVTDGQGPIPKFFTHEKRDASGTLLGYDMTLTIKVNAATRTATTYINDIEIETYTFTIDFREMGLSWYPQFYVTASPQMAEENHYLMSVIITDFTVMAI